MIIDEHRKTAPSFFRGAVFVMYVLQFEDD